MRGILKVVLIVLAVLIAATLILKTLGFVGNVTGSILMAPINLIVGLLGMVIGLIAGAFGLVLGLLGAVLGVGVLLIPILILGGVIAFMVWALGFVFKRSGRKEEPFAPDQSRTRKDLQAGIRRMEERIESLESLLSKN